MQAGERFPDATLGDDAGGEVRVRTVLEGGPAVFYFYPKDSTPGCTREAHDFQRHLEEFRGAGVRVFGVSADGPDSHRAFSSDCGLGFPLLVDAGGALGQPLGIWNAERGRHSRSTYLVDSAGLVRRVWPSVQVDGHAAEVLAAARDAFPPAAGPGAGR